MEMLTKEGILAVDDIKYSVVDVPEWGGSIRLKTMSGAERDSFDQLMLENRGPDKKANIQNFRARLVAFCACDSEGKPIFAPNDISKLGSKSGIALDRLADAASKLNALSKVDIEELEKN